MARIRREKLRIKKYQSFVVRLYWLVIILVLITAVLVEYFLIIKPRIEQTINGGPLDGQSRQVVLDEQRGYYEELKELKKQADEINQAELEKIDYVLEKNINLPGILKQITLLAEQSKMGLTSFDFDFGQGILTINLSLGGGSYQGIKQYLSEIEKNIRVMDVTGVSLRGMGSGFSLTIQSYYLE